MAATRRPAAARPAAAFEGPRPSARGRPRGAGREPLGIQALDLALEVLAQVARHPAGIGLADLSRATGLAPSKLHRYLVSFTRHDMLRQSPVSGLYELGSFARRVGAAAFNRYHGGGVMQEAVTALAARTGCTVCLYVWSELGPILLRLELGTRPLPVVLREGTALPVCASATGRVFLAHLSPDLTAPLVRAERALAAEEGLRVWTDAELEVEIRAIRAAPVYWTTDAVLPGAVAVAPVFDARGDLNAALAVVPGRGQARAAERDRLVRTIAATTRALSRDLMRAMHDSGAASQIGKAARK